MSAQRTQAFGVASECDGSCTEIYQYWRSLCRDGRLPSRADIDPAEISRRLLPNLLLLEPRRQTVEPKLRLWLRLVGTEIVEAYGREITGCFLDEVYMAQDYGDTMAQFEAMFETGHPACLRAETLTLDARNLNYERIVLPLASRLQVVRG